MKIKDYEFLYNIDALFEKKIIIYGAGIDGKRIYEILRAIPVNVECFCDRNPLEQQALPIPIISINKLREKIKEKNDYFIIVGSSDYCDEIISDLDKMQIQPSYICTWHAVRIGIELQINDKRFPDEFKNDFIQRKLVWNQNHALYHDLLYRMNLSVYPHAIMIYQIGKVGSSSIRQTLKHENITTVHVHHLMQKTGISQMDNGTTYFIEKFRKDGAKIISLIREPIARALSEFMQGFGREYILDNRCKSSDILIEARKWVENSLTKNEEFEWFDKEIKGLTGVDIYQYPFDKEQGYTIIKEGNIEILILKLEKLKDNIDKIGEFVGKPGIKLLSKNVGTDKSSKYIYKELQKNFSLPANIIKQQFENNPKLDHFYTENEKKAFLEKWITHSI